MNLLNKLTIKNLKLNKKRTIVTIVGIMLSVALITAVASIYKSGIDSLIEYEKMRKGDFHVSFYEVPFEDLAIFENNRAIEELNLTKDLGYAKIDSKNKNKPYVFIKAFTKKSLENLSIRLVEGKLPESDSEIVIPTHLKTDGRFELKVGDTITLDVGKRVDNEGNELNQNNPFYIDTTPENSGDVNAFDTGGENIINTTSKTYKIVGIIERPASNIENFSAPGYTVITYIDENKLTDNIDIFVRYNKKGLTNLYDITGKIINVDGLSIKKYFSNKPLSQEEYVKVSNEMQKSKYDININDHLIDLETNPLNNSSIGGLGAVAVIVIGIIIFTSVFCIKNSFDISITEKIKQYGMLRSIGATKKQIKKNVFYEASILGIIGIPLGIVLGLIASYLLIIISNYFLTDMLDQMTVNGIRLQFSFSIIAIILAIILGIITIYFSAFRSAKRASKVSPIDSIRNSANIKINSKKIKSPKIIKKIFGMGGEISYKNLKRNKKKYRTTVISIVVSVFVFIALSSFMTMAFDSIRNELAVTDINLSLSATNYSEEEYLKFLETTKFDNIENFVVIRQAGFRISDKYYRNEYLEWTKLDSNPEKIHYLDLIVIGDSQYNKYVKSLGLDYHEIKEKGILIDDVLLSKYDKDINDMIKKQMRVHNINKGDKITGVLDNSNQYDIEIGYVTDKRPFGLEYFTSSSVLIISDELFDKITKSVSIDIAYDSTDAIKLQDEIDEYLADIDYSLNNSDEQVRMMKNLFTLIGIFLYGFIIVITLIGITNIFNTITTNMELRRQEFAMLKSVGMTTKEFNRMIRLESLFMGLKALLFGIPIGIGLSYLIYHYLVSESGVPYKLPILAIILAIITVFILISIIMKYSINKINKQSTIETIRNENI